MCKWKLLSIPTRNEIKALIFFGIILVVLFDILSCLVDVLPWDVYQLVNDTGPKNPNSYLWFYNLIKHSFITMLYLLILVGGITFGVIAHALSKKIHKWLES